MAPAEKSRSSRRYEPYGGGSHKGRGKEAERVDTVEHEEAGPADDSVPTIAVIETTEISEVQIPVGDKDNGDAPAVIQATVITETEITEISSDEDDDDDNDVDVVIIDDDDDDADAEEESDGILDLGSGNVDENDIRSSGEEEEEDVDGDEGVSTGGVGVEFIDPFITVDDEAGYDPEKDPELQEILKKAEEEGENEICYEYEPDGAFDGMSAEDAHFKLMGILHGSGQ